MAIEECLESKYCTDGGVDDDGDDEVLEVVVGVASHGDAELEANESCVVGDVLQVPPRGPVLLSSRAYVHALLKLRNHVAPFTNRPLRVEKLE